MLKFNMFSMIKVSINDHTAIDHQSLPPAIHLMSGKCHSCKSWFGTGHAECRSEHSDHLAACDLSTQTPHHYEYLTSKPSSIVLPLRPRVFPSISYTSASLGKSEVESSCLSCRNSPHQMIVSGDPSKWAFRGVRTPYQNFQPRFDGPALALPATAIASRATGGTNSKMIE